MLPLAYFGNCGGFFQRYLEGKPLDEANKAYLTEGNKAVARRITELAKKYKCHDPSDRSGIFSLSWILIVSLCLDREMGKISGKPWRFFHIPFEEEDYIFLPANALTFFGKYTKIYPVMGFHSEELSFHANILLTTCAG